MKPRSSAPRVLIIDDSAAVRAAVEEILAPRGFAIASCASGYEAVARLPGEAPDLLLCDLVLPDVDGYQICRWVRQVPSLAATQVLLLSGIVDDEVEREAARLGIAGVLKKPLDPERLIAVAERATGRTPAADAARQQALLVQAARQVVSETVGLPGFRCLLQVAPRPRLLAQSGESTAAAAPLVAEPLVHLLNAAAAATAGMGIGELGLAVFEAAGGSLVVRRDEAGATLVLLVTNPASIGKARLLLGRLQRAMSAAGDTGGGADDLASAGDTG